jgi:hypothetical protein
VAASAAAAFSSLGATAASEAADQHKAALIASIAPNHTHRRIKPACRKLLIVEILWESAISNRTVEPPPIEVVRFLRAIVASGLTGKL